MDRRRARAGLSCHAVRVRDPKAIVSHGYDVVSRAYRADDADEGEYAAWLDLLEARLRAVRIASGTVYTRPTFTSAVLARRDGKPRFSR